MRYFKTKNVFDGTHDNLYDHIYITDDDMTVGSWYSSYKKYKNLAYKLQEKDKCCLFNHNEDISFEEISEGDIFLEAL